MKNIKIYQIFAKYCFLDKIIAYLIFYKLTIKKMVEVNGKNYVKDIENTPEVKNLVDDNFDFKAFDKKIEESFQTFLGSHKGSLENLTVQELQGWFNRWLDSVYLEFDDMKDKEIEKKII